MKHIHSPMLDREMKKGSAELLILSLVETRARHGYEIGKLIEARSKGVLKFKVATQHVAIFRGSDQSNHWIGKCLIGKPKFASACRVCNSHPRVRTPSSRKWHSTSMNTMRSC